MAQWHKFVLFYLWIAPHALLLGVLALMFIRRWYKKFPVFFLYTLYEIFEFLLLFAVGVNTPLQNIVYRYVFTVTLAGSIALRFGIIQEVLNNVLRDYPGLEATATVAMRWLTGLLVLAAILAAAFPSGTPPDRWMAGVAVLDRSVAIIQAGLLLFLFWFSRMFGLSWRRFEFGIALGFGILASTELAVSALHLRVFTEHAKDLLDLVPTGSYHISVLVWLGYLLAAEKPVRAAPYPLPEIDQWSGELERSR